jgi:hypothetical protein
MIKEIRFCLNADEAPSLPGAYAMAIELTDKALCRPAGGWAEPSKKDLVAASAASIMSFECGLIYAMAAFA